MPPAFDGTALSDGKNKISLQKFLVLKTRAATAAESANPWLHGYRAAGLQDHIAQFRGGPYAYMALTPKTRPH
jgi:hypothetical protein